MSKYLDILIYICKYMCDLFLASMWYICVTDRYTTMTFNYKEKRLIKPTAYFYLYIYIHFKVIEIPFVPLFLYILNYY